MSERTERHETLRRIVSSEEIETQSRMIEALAEEGLEVHQSTLSRDLRELGIRKRGGRYRPADPTPVGTGAVDAPGTPTPRPTADPETPGARPTMPVVHDVIPCGPNLITVRAGTGQAQLLGVLLDEREDPAIAGTIAGDDTVLVITRGRPEQRAALALLESWFGEGRRDAI